MKNTKKKMNPILWFLFAIVIPLVVAGTLTVVILTFTGVDVLGWAKDKGSNIPVVSSFIKTDEEVEAEEQQEKLESTITKQKEEITSLEESVNNLESAIDQFELDIIKLENKESSEVNASEENEEKVEAVDTVKTLSASFKKMNKKQAALIFQDLDKTIAVSLMQELPNDVRGGILEAMDPKQAADLAKLFVNSTE